MREIKRKFHLSLELGVDDFEQLKYALDSVMFQLYQNIKCIIESNKNEYKSVSGSPSSVNSFTFFYDSNMTHEKYIDLIKNEINENP